MDLIDHYLGYERGHAPTLLNEIDGRTTGTLAAFSNLFNFQIDFDRGEVTIEEDGCYFHDRDGEREMVVGLGEFVERLSRWRSSPRLV
ncbi:MAG: hypothetical protein AAF845_12505 [Bacteroidota bacterium]